MSQLARLVRSSHMPALGRARVAGAVRWHGHSHGGEPCDGDHGPPKPTEDELRLSRLLSEQLQPVALSVADVSGGCGSFFQIEVTSSRFKGLSTVQQHRLVNEILKEEIAKVHGVTLKTKAA